jgi:hypothetical protein
LDILKLTFGICTGGGQEERIKRILDSISAEARDSEVLVIGPWNDRASGATPIPFDESAKKGWITRKKNLIAAQATGDVIVYMHDYVALSPGWGIAWKHFGWDWDVAVNVVRKHDGTRAFDWFAIDYKEWRGPNLVDYSVKAEGEIKAHMYPAGNFFLARRGFMLAHPLDESLCWGQNEDYQWMRANSSHWRYALNPRAEAIHLKPDHHHNPNYASVIAKP